MTRPPKSSLTLIGVVHRDPLGEQRVMSLLEKLQCDAISLEVSRFALQWRLKNSLPLAGRVDRIAQKLSGNGQAVEHGEIQGILHMLTIPFEVRVAHAFAQQTGAPYFLLDDSDLSRKLLSLVEQDMITEANIAAILTRPDFDFSQSIEQLYEQCSRILNDEPLPRLKLGLSDEQLQTNERRDERIQRQLEKLMADIPGHWVHICGFTHILRAEGFRNMASRFPRAQRILAISYPGRSSH